MVALSVTHLNVPLICEVRSQQNGVAKFQITAGRCTLESGERCPLGEALRTKVAKIVQVPSLEGTQDKRASGGVGAGASLKV